MCILKQLSVVILRYLNKYYIIIYHIIYACTGTGDSFGETRHSGERPLGGAKWSLYPIGFLIHHQFLFIISLVFTPLQ